MLKLQFERNNDRNTDDEDEEFEDDKYSGVTRLLLGVQVNTGGRVTLLHQYYNCPLDSTTLNRTESTTGKALDFDTGMRFNNARSISRTLLPVAEAAPVFQRLRTDRRSSLCTNSRCRQTNNPDRWWMCRSFLYLVAFTIQPVRVISHIPI